MSSLDAVPRELCELITSRLQPAALRSLGCASHSFGQLPTSHLATRLHIALPTLNCLSHGLPGRTPRLSCVTYVAVTGAREQHAAAPPCSRLMQLVTFVARLMPSMQLLTKVALACLSLSTVIAVTASACPRLGWLELISITQTQEPNAPAQSDLWPALAAITALRHLKLRSLWMAQKAVDGPLLGVGRVTQLLSLHTNGNALHLSDVLLLTGLTQLTAGPLLGPCPDAVHLLALCRQSHLQRLKLRAFMRYQLPDGADLHLLHALAACRGLSHLHVSHCVGNFPLSLIKAFTQLTTLRAYIEVTCSELAAMPALRFLECFAVALPTAGSGVVVPHVRVINCNFFCNPTSVGDVTLQTAQVVAQTFPQMTALGWQAEDVEGQSAMLWPEVGGELLHCRKLWLPKQSSRPLAQCAVALHELRLGAFEDPYESYLPTLLTVGRHLRRLEVDSPAMTDGHLSTLIGSLSALEEVAINMGHPSPLSVTDVGLAALSRLPRLRWVGLFHLQAVTPVGVAALAVEWSVEVIEVCSCPQISAGDVARLHVTLGRPQLDIVHSLAGWKQPKTWDWLCASS